MWADGKCTHCLFDLTEGSFRRPVAGLCAGLVSAAVVGGAVVYLALAIL
jgi:hypothetical protein